MFDHDITESSVQHQIQSLIIYMKDPTPLYNFNYFINTNIYTINLKENQRGILTSIKLVFPLYSTRTLQVSIFKIHGKKKENYLHNLKS